MEKIRLQKYISECGIMSRRAAEAEILAGHIKINGIPASLGDKVDPEFDEIEINGKILEKKTDGERESRRLTYILLNKPSGFVTTMSDEQGRKTVSDLLADVPTRVYPVGRLDLYSDGLLLCTNDGDLTNRITHPSHQIPKKYLATVTSHLSESDISALSEPFELDGYMLKPFGVEFVEHKKVQNKPSTVVRFTLYEGRNREIRKICAHHDLKLARLTRVSIGELSLRGIAPGKWRYLTDDEIEYIKKI